MYDEKEAENWLPIGDVRIGLQLHLSAKSASGPIFEWYNS
jgi:hypothetical protein